MARVATAACFASASRSHAFASCVSLEPTSDHGHGTGRLLVGRAAALRGAAARGAAARSGGALAVGALALAAAANPRAR